MMQKTKLILVFIVLLISSLPCYAQSEYVVSNSNDSGSGSLRQAILDYNARGFYVGIRFNVSSVFISSPLPAVRNYPPPVGYALSIPVVSGIVSNFLHIYATTPAASYSDGLYYLTSDNIPFNKVILRIFGFNDTFNSFAADIQYHGFLPKSFIVTTNSSTGPGSLSRLMEEADYRQVTTYDSIVFNIPGTAPQIIQTTPSGFVSTSQVILDGSTQPANGYTGTAPKIEIDGSLYPTATGISTGAGSSIFGLNIHGFTQGTGLAIPYANTTVGKAGNGNVISENKFGIQILVRGGNITIQNNIIGLDYTGTTAIPNTIGIDLGVNTGTPYCQLTALYNTISGNTQYGIYGGRHSTFIIKGNNIGVSSDGTAAIGNGEGLIAIDATLTLGGPGNERNIISGNRGNAVRLVQNGTANSLTATITNNYIGTDITGTLDLGNEGTALSLANYTSLNAKIGGASLAEGNIIAYNKIGIVNYKGTLIQYNSIFNNDIGVQLSPVQTPFLDPPIIAHRSTSSISGTAVANSTIQLFEDNGFNRSPQGKVFIAEVSSDASGNWIYNGAISDPCKVTAICLLLSSNYSSLFSSASLPDLVPDSLSFCSGTVAEINAAEGYDTYQWSNSASTKTLSVTTPGSYNVEVYNGCSYTSSVDVYFVNKPTIALGNDTTYCTSSIMHKLKITPTANAVYAWYANGSLTTANTSTYTPTQNGIYIGKATISQCISSDTISLLINTSPNIRTKVVVKKCIGQTYTMSKPTGNTYTWSDGSNANTLTITDPGIYTVIATGSSGCSTDYSRDTITINDVSTTAQLGKDTIVCVGQSVALNAPSTGDTYSWYSKVGAASSFNYASSASSYNATQAGNYALRIQNGNCIQYDTLFVTFVAIPYLTLGKDTSICMDATLNFNFTFPGAKYIWSDGSTSNAIQIVAPGTYTSEVYYNDACLSKDTIIISFINCNVTSTYDAFNKLDISFGPNPFTGSIRLNSAIETIDADYYLIDMQGSILKAGHIDGSSQELDLSGFAKGIYTIKLVDKDNHFYFQKVIKQ